MLELAILGLLKEQELHGYELKKRVVDTLGAGSVSFGSLYPALGRLERAGAVRSVAAEASPVGRAGRSRKVYAITPAGEEMFVDLLAAEPGADNRMFSLRLAFARYLSADARLGMLERRRVQLVERLSRFGARGRGGRGRIDGYLHSLMEHDREATEHDLSWIDRLIAGERAARGMPAGGTAGGRPADGGPADGGPADGVAVGAGNGPATPTPPGRDGTAPFVADRPSLSGLRAPGPTTSGPRPSPQPPGPAPAKRTTGRRALAKQKESTS